MRATDKKRFTDLGRQLREIRDGTEWTTRGLARALHRSQSWAVEVEGGKSHVDLFDYVRMCRLLGLTGDEAMSLLESIVDDPALDLTPAEYGKLKLLRRPEPKGTHPPKSPGESRSKRRR